MSKFNCNLCGSTVEGDFKSLHDDLDDWMLKMILREHPKWKETDGACPKCLEELKKRYKQVDEMEILP